MRVHHRSAAVLAALLLAAAPASATLITPPLLLTAAEVAHQPSSQLLEFDVEGWASFISSDAPEYELSALGSGIDEFGGASEFQMPLPIDIDDELILTQVSIRP
ncbi:MAG: hypothetical protein JRG80_13655 [Deltaproteobacteria bacterium]|nr:hypothetical protein [Deltaproteobacteria bacterium]MBW2400303.1 hypothetical protein [Deltaproteobacteria bacterium]MBW2664676.1 hypothetical protein [Deltaproteobacteria bacterium]